MRLAGQRKNYSTKTAEIGLKKKQGQPARDENTPNSPTTSYFFTSSPKLGESGQCKTQKKKKV